DENQASTKSFSVRRIDSPLFDDNKLHILGKVKFRNFIWQDIIRQLSLSQKVRGKARGRISYANLGINQLGSVYEGLLSYKGFFANEDYIEVKKADDANGKDGTYVVPRRRRGDFEEDEILKDSENQEQDVIIPKGSFIYRLSGRDRQKSASYYTPEVLTTTTVKYTLKPILERLSKGEIKADELLKLKILEPAMGAAAFHNEVINQLAEAYLQNKQNEKKNKIRPNNYRDELQKVKAYIATHNVYGVDLNPTAVELGKISLWLNVIHKKMETPFFGYRLGVGNAVIGAWAKVYNKKEIIKEFEKNSRRVVKKEWWNSAPRQLAWTGKGGRRKSDEIYHFLLPDKNMVPSANIKMLKDEYQKETKHIREWKKSFFEPITAYEFIALQFISKKIDELFNEHYEQQKIINEKTHTKVEVWGQPGYGQEDFFNYTAKEDYAHQREQANAPYYKLKTIMDYWCSLWFWDMREAASLPTREDYLSDLVNILELDLEKLLAEQSEIEKDVLGVDVQPELKLEGQQIPLLDYKSDEEKSSVSEVISKYTKKTDLFENNRLSLVKNYSNQYRFFHYELEFIEVFKERGGFDVIVGNPPWVKITFEEGDIISEIYPEVFLRNFTAPMIREYANTIIDDTKYGMIFKDTYIEAENVSNFSNGYQNFDYLVGQQGNLYKAVIQVSFQVVSPKGFIGLLHPETIYDDPNGQALRKVLLRRLYYHFQFLNELLLFSEVGHRMLFSINIYRGNSEVPNFISINNLFHPVTIDSSFIHDGIGNCGGFKIKDDKQNKFVWNIKPHFDRIVNYKEVELKLLSQLFDDGINWNTVKLANIQSSKIIAVLTKLSSFKTKVSDFENIITVAWDETNAINEGIILRETKYPVIEDYEMVYSGPHTHVANPLSKTPREICSEKGHYDVIDLNLVNENFLQRTNYIPVQEINLFIQQIHGFVIDYDQNNNPVYENWINYFKLSFSKMLNTSSERTLQPAIIYRKTSHINGVISIVFRTIDNLLEFSSISSSIIFDFLIKTIGTANLTNSRINSLPLGIDEIYKPYLFSRILRLNCLNTYYSELWEIGYKQINVNDNWSIEDPRLSTYENVTSKWSWNSPLRNFFERRIALIEIDVITSLAFNLTLDELISTYSISFSMMQQYEDDTWYDRKGNIIFTVNRALTGVGLSRSEWENVKDNKEGDLVEHTIEYELHRGTTITYYPPFEKCDRIEDYKRAWAHFEKVFADKE
ncbi:MAG: hypothetical protein H6609_19365, partial [Ignavibacteriales bacterium]|nr:hypothetical protein [Ignavibacteriales bacterium]